MDQWFVAHKTGLRQIAERLVKRRGFGFIGGELYQNVMDTDATVCKLVLEKTRNRGRYILTCEDNDQTGFTDLTHAYTVFAPSLKKNDPEKAGRFNIGEKFVLAFCCEAQIETTKGTVIFNAKGREDYPRRKREVGTKFWATIDCNKHRMTQFLAYMQRIIVRPGLKLTVNDIIVPPRKPIAVFNETLCTEQGDDLRPTKRKGRVEIYEPTEGEVAMIYELGIPVVETGDKWHYSVCQKVPLNIDRDNVTPAYLRDLRVYVFNHMHKNVTPDGMTALWVDGAASDDKVIDEPVADFKRKRYGENAVAEDPFNPDANAAALVDGRALIPKHGLTQGQRENLKRRGLLLSSTQAYPIAGKGAYSDNPDAPTVKVIPDTKWTEGMHKIFEYTQGVAQRLIGKELVIRFVIWPRRQGGTWRACYGTGDSLGLSFFDYNVGVIGRRWFDKGVTEDTDSLIIHELGHEFCANHADENYHRALTKLGAKLKTAVLADPGWFRKFLHSCRTETTNQSLPEAKTNAGGKTPDRLP